MEAFLVFVLSGVPLLVLLVILYLLASTRMAVRRIEEKIAQGTANGFEPSGGAAGQ